MLHSSTLEVRKCNLSVTCMGPFRRNCAPCHGAVSGWLISSSFHSTKGVSFDNFIPNCPFCPVTEISRGEFLHCFKNSCCRKVIQQELGSHIFYLKENSSRRGNERIPYKLNFKVIIQDGCPSKPHLRSLCILLSHSSLSDEVSHWISP